MFAFADKKRGYLQPSCKKCFNFRAREKWHKEHPNASFLVKEEAPTTPNNINEIILNEKNDQFFIDHYQNGLKKCAACAQFKNISEYYVDKTKRDGLLTRCKDCATKPDLRRLNHLKKPWLQKFSNMRSRAKKLKLPFNLTKEFIQKLFEESDGICPVLKVPMKMGGNLQYVPSLDRIKPELGYVIGNVRLISYRANSLKQDATIEELTLVLKDLEKNYR